MHGQETRVNARASAKSTRWPTISTWGAAWNPHTGCASLRFSRHRHPSVCCSRQGIEPSSTAQALMGRARRRLRNDRHRSRRRRCSRRRGRRRRGRRPGRQRRRAGWRRRARRRRRARQRLRSRRADWLAGVFVPCVAARQPGCLAAWAPRCLTAHTQHSSSHACPPIFLLYLKYRYKQLLE